MRFLALSAALLFAGGLAAHADTFTFSFAGALDSGSGELTASAMPAAGQFLVTGISGTVDGSAINDLLPAGVFPTNYEPANDNLLFYAPANPNFFDYNGLAFTTVSGSSYELFTDSNSNFLIEGIGSLERTSDSLTSLSIAATPEPSSMLLLGTGLLGAAAALRRRSLA